MFRKGARKRSTPYETLTTNLIDNKLPLRSLLHSKHLSEIWLWDSDGSQITLLYDERDGFSYQNFSNNETYDVKTQPISTEIKITRNESFSKVTLDTVLNDFSLKLETNELKIEPKNPVKSLPGAFLTVLELFEKFSVLHSENSRRSLVEMYTLFAINEVDKNQGFLKLDAELKMTITREINRGGDSTEFVEYSGPLDFVVGHSMTDRIPKDTALILVEAKRRATFDEGLAQALAQASTVLSIRREKKRGKNRYFTYWIYTDGEKWCMGYVRPDGENIKYGKTEEYKASIRNQKEEAILELFNYVVELVAMSRMSTPTGSLQDLTPSDGDDDDDDVDREVLVAEINRIDLNHANQ